MIVALTVALLVAALLVGILLGDALRRRQELAQKDVTIGALKHLLEKESDTVELLMNDVALLKDNARAEAHAHTTTITMLMKEIENAEHATA